MNILGISAFYHDSSCCLIQNGNLIAAASEERFTRIKHDARLPVNAYKYCLEQANLIPTDLDAIAYYENPIKKTARRLAFADLPASGSDLEWIDPQVPLRMIREYLGFDGQLLCFDHHESHAASAFYFSGFTEAATFTVDGVGEWATTSYGQGDGDSLSLFETVDFPHSIGLLYSAITGFLGFRVNSGEYKVMGLAPYGKPAYLESLWNLISMGPNGQYRLDLSYFDFIRGSTMYSSKLSELLRIPPRRAESDITQDHKNLAKSVQVLCEEVLLSRINYLYQAAGSDNLAMAGGVALNAVANGRIRREGPFQNVFVQPASGDSGGCLGAAALAHVRLTKRRHSQNALTNVFLGPEFSSREVSDVLGAAGLETLDYSNDEAGLLQAVVDRLLENKTIGWFQGRMEFGPRALGGRSIIANPMNPDVKDQINRAVKRRESFRPFAPAIMHDHVERHMDITHFTPFMIETCQVTSALKLPAVTHVDGSARPQTVTEAEAPRFYRLLSAFYERSGCPILLNTSFNQRGEPIVCSPIDALISLGSSSLDVLVIEDFIIDRENLPENWQTLLEAWGLGGRSLKTANPVIDNLYTF